MSSNNKNNNNNNNDTTPTPSDPSRPRRGSITAQTLSSLFTRSNSTSGGPIGPFPQGPITTAAQDHKRRMSISTLGLSGTSPTTTQPSPFPFANRRSSVSTAGSESIDENAIDDDDGPGRSNPTTPFARRMSFGAQALRSARAGNGSPGSSGDGVFNWSEQLRSRAESTVSQSQRPPPSMTHERAKSVSEMPAPPTAAILPQPPKPARKQPDAFEERILKGDFYM